MENPVAIANKMWKLYRMRAMDRGWLQKTDQDKLTDFSGEGFADFINKYSIQSRQMIINGEYHVKAFKQYLEQEKQEHPGMEGWAKLQAYYIKYLYINLNKGEPNLNKNAKKIWTQTWENLYKEMTEFKEDFEEAKKQAEDNKKILVEERREDLLKMVGNNDIQKKIIEALMNDK